MKLQLPDPCAVPEALGTAASLATPRVRAVSGSDIFRSIDELIVLKVLGRGTFASVRQAIHRPSGRIFALKTVRRDRVLQEGGQAEHLVREATCQLRMRHPNIVLLYGHFEDSERVHFVLEFVAGGQLLQRMRKIGRLSGEEAARMFSNVISALIFIHQHNIVHRDIKPENVLLQQQDKSDKYIAKIGDFGCCAMVSDLEPTRNTLCGTMDYLAPEMIDQQPHDHGVDVWASGVLLYEMLVGEPPFKAKSQLEALRKILSSEVQCPSFMDNDAADLIRLLLQKKCKSRLPLAQAANHVFVTKFVGEDPAISPAVRRNSCPVIPEEKKNDEEEANATPVIESQSNSNPLVPALEIESEVKTNSKPAIVSPSNGKPFVPTLRIGSGAAKTSSEQEHHGRQSISPVIRRPSVPQTARLARSSRSPPPCQKPRLSTPATMQARPRDSPKVAPIDADRRASADLLLPLESAQCEHSSIGDCSVGDDASEYSHLAVETPSGSFLSGGYEPPRNSPACNQMVSNSAQGDGSSSTSGLESVVRSQGIESSIGTYSCSSRATAGGLSLKTSRLRSLTPPQGELEETAAKVSIGCRTPEARSQRSGKSPTRTCESSPRDDWAFPVSSSSPVLMQSALLAQEAAYQLEADTSQLAVCSREAPRAKAASIRKGPPSEPRTSTSSTPNATSSSSVITSGSSYVNLADDGLHYWGKRDL